MSVRGTLGGAFAAVAVLVIGWQAGAAALDRTTGTAASTSSSGSTGGSTGTGSSGSSSGSTGTGSTSTGSTASSSTSLKDGTYTGDTESTRYGDVQVSVTVSGGKITDVTALHLTDDDGRSVEISNRAAPVLREEVLAAQSGQVDYVSGATYTSDGYLRSVQSALDQAAQ